MRVVPYLNQNLSLTILRFYPQKSRREMASRAMSSAAEEAAFTAVQSIGLGYDLTSDLRLNCCKQLPSSGSSAYDSRLISVDDSEVRSLLVPGGISIPNVPVSIHCDEGERKRFSSDILSFLQMSEQFNQELSLPGKIPSGCFNAEFDFSGSWEKDAANTKTLAFDGVFITLYDVALHKSQIVLRDQVKQAVPSSWDPDALARFIDTYGTHVIVGVQMGGKDVIYVKQQHSSPLQPADVQKKLKDMADKLFTEGPGPGSQNSNDRDMIQDINFSCKRKGGQSGRILPHEDWCQTVQLEPDVISMSFIPVSSLLSGVNGSGFLAHAINLYLRYKPPIEELRMFLEFQLARQWAPVFGELTLGPDRMKQTNASLQFSFLGPKLYVNTVLVDAGKRPVTGLRLYLTGKRSNCLGVHLQHLSTPPKAIQLADEQTRNLSHSSERKYYEKVRWKSFSQICTAPVESDDDLSIVTGAHFEVGDSGLKKVLFLRLHFSKVMRAMAVRISEWEGSPSPAPKLEVLSITQKPSQKSTDVYLNSAVYPGGPPTPAPPKLLRFVDTAELTRGPEASPGYWVVAGAKLHVEKGKISIRVKYSLLATML